MRILPVATMLSATLLIAPADARRFYDDDPLWKEPKPVRVEKMKSRKINDYYDFFHHTLATPGERSTPQKPIPAQGVNTLGEVPDGAWYVNRISRRAMTVDELVKGPDQPLPPSEDGHWRIVGAKTQGVTPGFTIVDSRGTRYLLKFDPPTNPEMATAADVIGSAFFHALGYHVPENYVVYFPPSRLVLDPKTTFIDGFGKKRPMTGIDVDQVMHNIARDKRGHYRGSVSLYLKGQPVGERRFYGTRADDPNDIVPHEHRRDLRGLYVMAAWLGHDDSRSINSLDMLVEDGGDKYVRHYLIDFGSILGSASTKSNSARSGNEYLFSWKPAAKEVLTLGIWVPRWARASYPDFPSVGKFESRIFDPEHYRPEYPNPAFNNCQPADAFWAAKQVMRFSNEAIGAIIRKGQYSDPQAAEYLTKCLIERRDKIGKTYFAKVLPLDNFEVRDGKLAFDDLAVSYKFSAPRDYAVEWSRFDNERETLSRIEGAGLALPPAALRSNDGEYFAAVITAQGSPHRVTVYLRHRGGRFSVVGLDR
jgi:hypothetical protein